MKQYLAQFGAASTLLFMLLAACGGSGSGSGDIPDPEPPPPDGPFVRLQRFTEGVGSGFAVGADGAVYGLARTSLLRIDAAGTVTKVREFFVGRAFTDPDCFTSVGGLVAGPSGSFLIGALPCSDEVSQVGQLTAAGDYTFWDSSYPASLDGPAFDSAGRVYVTSAGDEEVSGRPSFVSRLDGPGATAWTVDFGASIGLERPQGPLAQGVDGWLYGVASPYRAGYEPFDPPNAVFRIATDGTVQTVRMLVAADGVGDVLLPGLLLDPDGWIVGVTSQGGDLGFGSIWRMRTDGTGLEALHHFAWAGANGNLLRAPDGRIYGTVRPRGDAGNGLIYRLAVDGTFTVLHEFVSPSQQPVGTLLLHDGLLYGTTWDRRSGRGAPGDLYRFRVPD